MTLHIRVSKNGKLLRTEGTNQEGLIAALEAGEGNTRIAVFAHGGLVAESKGLARAEHLSQADQLARLGTPLVFPVWKSNILSTLTGNLTEIARSKAIMDVALALFNWISSKYGGDGTSSRGQELTDTQLMQLAQALAQSAEGGDTPSIANMLDRAAVIGSDIPDAPATGDLEDRIRALKSVKELSTSLPILLAQEKTELNIKVPTDRSIDAKDLVEAKTFLQNLSDEARETLIAEVEKEGTPSSRALFSVSAATLTFLGTRAVKSALAVLRRHRSGRDHGLWPTIVEEVARAYFVGGIGSTIWGEMKGDAADCFEPGGEGTALLASLGDLQSRLMASGRTLEIALIGHSAGCIYLAHMLAAIKRDGRLGDASIDLVLMASAADHELLGRSLNMVRPRSVAVYNLSAKAEIEDRVLGAFYPRSLLYLVSGLFEGDASDKLLTGMERSFDLDDGQLSQKERAERLALADWMPATARVTAPTDQSAIPPAQSTAQKHGDFSLDDQTIASVVAALTLTDAP